MRSRVVAIAFAGASVGLSACGYLSIDFAPADAADPDAAIDGADDGNASSNDANGGTDALVDSGPDAGRCIGPSCPGVVYVSHDVGLDTNPGTSDAPMKTISEALQRAQARAANALYVAGGTYAEDVHMVEGVTIAGGFSCSAAPCTWDWDPLQYRTIVEDQTTNGIVAGPSITQATVLDGVEVHAYVGTSASTTTSIAISLAGGSPTVQRCAVVGATNTLKSIGISITAPTSPKDPRGPMIAGCMIGAGAAQQTSAAIDVTPTAGIALTATIAGSQLEAKSGSHSYGIFVDHGATVNIVGNRILAGAADSSGQEPDSWGISIYTSTATIERNRINVDDNGGTRASCASENQWCGGVFFYNGGGTVRSNAIRGAANGRSAAVRLFNGGGAIGDFVVNGNALDAEGGGSIGAALVIGSSVGSTSLGRVRNNILGPGKSETRYGVLEDVNADGVHVHLVALDNNFFFVSSDASNEHAYGFFDGNTLQPVAFSGLGTVTPTPNANVEGAPPYTMFPHVSTTSGVIDMGTATEAAPKDIDGDDRTPPGNPVDIGADEAK